MGFLDSFLYSTAILVNLFLVGCGTFKAVSHQWYQFPAQAFVESPAKPYKILGTVRSTVNFRSLDYYNDEKKLCKNYYNKAVQDLLKYARAEGADAVIQVRSVVFFGNGMQEVHTTAECSDDGLEGQVLTQGLAVKWIPDKVQIVK